MTQSSTAVRHRDLWDITIRATAIVSLVLSFAIGYRQWEYTRCKAKYDNKAAVASAARTDAAEQDRVAQDRMWQAFADASDPSKVPPAQARQYSQDAFNRFLADRAEANRKRLENPLPPPPAQVCE